VAYLTLEEFRLLSVFAGVNDLEAEVPGWIDAQLEAVSADIDSRLRKRYAVPFGSPAPHTIRRWLSRLVTRECYLRRGIDPTDPQWTSIEAAATKAEEEIREAADSEGGLFDLPLRADSTSSGVTSPAVLSYIETSPYVWRDRQVAGGREDDARGEGRRS
jgi:hypothetical protein